MNKTITTAIAGSILMMLAFLSANVKEKRGDDFLRINNNIQNEELRSELKSLKEEFNLERTRIQEYYTETIEALRKVQRGEIKTIKKDFVGRREALMKKYNGKMRKKTPKGTNEPIINVPNKKKVPPKDKKKIRKP